MRRGLIHGVSLSLVNKAVCLMELVSCSSRPSRPVLYRCLWRWFKLQPSERQSEGSIPVKYILSVSTKELCSQSQSEGSICLDYSLCCLYRTEVVLFCVYFFHLLIPSGSCNNNLWTFGFGRRVHRVVKGRRVHRVVSKVSPPCSSVN